MIVKNEAHVIIKTLINLTDKINFSYWVIGDNGSTDDTKELIKNFFNEKKIPGELYEDEWVDFGYNRTKALERAYNKSDYVFIFDADDELCGEINIPYDSLISDGYHFNIITGIKYMRVVLVNNRKKWKYTGILHEYIEIANKESVIITKLEGDYYIKSNRDGARNKNPNKYLNDAVLLENAFNKAIIEKDNIANRYVFYCANSYKDANKMNQAIEWYEKTLIHDGWIQEKYISCLNLYDLYTKNNQVKDGLYYLVKSYSYDKTRIEGIYELVKYYCINNMSEIAYQYYKWVENYYENFLNNNFVDNKLFLRINNYSFYFPYYMIIVGERTKNYETCVKMYEIIFKKMYLDTSEWWVRNLFFNIQFIIDNLPNDINFLNSMLEYVNALRKKRILLNSENYKIIDNIINKYRPLLVLPTENNSIITKSPINIMMTITTCKRFNLFEQTMNSIMKMWKDINIIDYFFCVDDNSSTEDRDNMKNKYPFFDYYLKSHEEKGHRASMNIIWDKLNEIKPTYWIHLEDDWLFFKSENYITNAINILEKYQEQNIHQVVFNKHYGLMMSQMDINGGKILEPGVLLHEQTQNISGKNCAYWPHYSLHPSVIRTSVILKIGNYNSPNTFFERDYANKYYENGYQTAFFDSIYSLHIGKQHWEKEGHNAYSLNEINQK
jgi:hypothetical protein